MQLIARCILQCIVLAIALGLCTMVSAKRNLLRASSSPIAPSEGMKLILVAPRGFCEGVRRAVETVDEALRVWGAPIYVKHEIVHNKIVCDRLRAKGAIFIEDLNEVPEGATLVYSAHGIPPEVRQQAKSRRLVEVDATCPMVTKVHVYVKKRAQEGYRIVLIGHKNHVEVIGVAAEAPEQTTVVESPEDVARLPFGPDDKIFYAAQTTLSTDDIGPMLDALLERYPQAETIPSGSICYATTNRQSALKAVVEQADLTLVVGDQMSSNSQRLRETAANRRVKAHLISGPDDIDPSWLRGVRTITLTAGASTPEDNYMAVVERLRELGVTEVEEFVHQEEDMHWKLPKNLEDAIKAVDGKKRPNRRKQKQTAREAGALEDQ